MADRIYTIRLIKRDLDNLTYEYSSVETTIEVILDQAKVQGWKEPEN